MTTGTLETAITTLNTALSGITTLSGSTDGNGSGLQGSAKLLQDGPTANLTALGGNLNFQAVFNFDGEGNLTNLLGVMEQIKGGLNPAELQGLNQFTQQISGVDQLFSGDFINKIQQLITTINAISQGLPKDKKGIFSLLLEQTLDVLKSMRGEEAGVITQWISAIEQQVQELQPILSAVENAMSPSLKLWQIAPSSAA